MEPEWERNDRSRGVMKYVFELDNISIKLQIYLTVVLSIDTIIFENGHNLGVFDNESIKWQRFCNI